MRGTRSVSNVEIADCMLRAGGPVTVQRVVALLEEHHPELFVDVAFVRTRLAMFERSKNVICVVDKEKRPATYHMMQIYQEFFRCSRTGEPLDFSKTIIPKKNTPTDVGLSELVRLLWGDIERKRLTHATCSHSAPT